MKVGILNIGTEILFGQIVNSNSAFLSKQLQNLGFDVLYHNVCGDNQPRVLQTLDYLYKTCSCDIVITTGGLGPTQDDMTKEAISEYFNLPLEKDEEVLEEIIENFKKRNRSFSENNKRQAYFPKNSVIMKNPQGTAPGFYINTDGKHLFSFPGPPRELETMFLECGIDIFKEISDKTMYYKILRMFGIGESFLEQELMDVIDNQTDPTLATYAKLGECQLRIASQRDSLKEAKEAVDNMISTISKKVGKYIYSQDDEDMNEVLVKTLKAKNLTIATAESCTGGLLAKLITDVSGASSVYKGGYVTYSNSQKKKDLNVSGETLKRYGAVSEEIAKEMVEGLKRNTSADVCIVITGVAGPKGSDLKAPGLMHIGLIVKDKLILKKIETGSNDRDRNRNYGVLSMMNLILENIV